jgi:hypothetical protein
MNDLDKIIGEVAAANGATLGRDDPIMILVTVVDQIAQKYDDAQKRRLVDFAAEIESMMQRTLVGVRSESERIINATLAASDAKIKETLLHTEVSLEQTTIKVSNAVAAQVNNELRTIKVITFFNILSAIVILIAALVLR